MTEITWRKRARWLMVFTLAVLAVPAVTWAAWRPDPWITAKTKIALATSAQVSAMNVNVDTVDGRVTLHGKVPTETAKDSADTVAAGIDGVKEVRNLLQVVPAAKAEKVEVKDDAIADAVKQALKADDMTRDSGIEVESVNDGVVLLGGHASSLLQHLAAIRDADSVDGVRRVATEVQSSDELYDEKLWHDPTRDLESETKGATKGAVDSTKEAANAVADASSRAWKETKDAAEAGKDAVASAGHSVSEGASKAGAQVSESASAAAGVVEDVWITSAAKTRLLANSDVPALAINVDTDDGLVTLFGLVPSQKAKKEAEAEVRQVSGVQDVKNRLEVSAAPPAAVEMPDDAEVEADVKNAIKDRAMFDDCNIRVSADEGVVHLSGRVPERDLVLAAATVARSVDGVRSVRNDIRVAPAVDVPRELTR